MIYKIKEWKEITIKESITRKVTREYTKKLMWDNKVSSDWKVNFSLADTESANDYLFSEMTGLTQDEIDNLDNLDYKEIMTKVIAVQNLPPRP